MAPYINVESADCFAGVDRTDRLAENPVSTGRRHTMSAASTGPGPLVVIDSIATGVPELARSQAESADTVAKIMEVDQEQHKRISRIYAKTRIQTRHMAVDPLSADFDRNLTIRERMNQFLEHAAPLATDVSGRALAEAHVRPADVGMLILVTSTGFIAPGVDVAVMKGLGLSPSVPRAVVNFMGCAAAMNGLRLASNFVRAHPRAKALVCCVELSSVNAVWANNINDTIISSLFADGCAAMVVTSTNSANEVPGKIVIREQFNQFVENSVDGITLGVNHNGITCDLSAKLPLYIRGGLDPVISKVLARHSIAKSDIDLWAIHPGGPKIIEESIRSLGIDEQVATKSWEVLAEYGNMLSASLPFVLKAMLAESPSDKPVSSGVAFSFAPGITVEGILFDVVTEKGNDYGQSCD